MTYIIGQNKHRVFTIHYTLKDSTGDQLETTQGDEPLVFLTGVGQIIPGLETELEKLGAGDKKSITVAAAQGYGEYMEELVVEVPRAQFPKKDIAVGDQFQAEGEGGRRQVVVVTEVTDEAVTVDGNHPLAGEELTFDVEVVAIRQATTEEIAHRHVHSEGGHHH